MKRCALCLAHPSAQKKVGAVVVVVLLVIFLMVFVMIHYPQLGNLFSFLAKLLSELGSDTYKLTFHSGYTFVG